MNIKLAVGNAILGTLTLTFASYAQSNGSVGSEHLSNIQSQTCPTFLNNNTTSTIDHGRLAIPSRPNEGLDLTVLCHSRPANFADISSGVTGPGHHPGPTPQSAAQFEQLPQDRVEFERVEIETSI